MSERRHRKVKLWSNPTVEPSYWTAPSVTVTVEGEMGATRITATGSLSPECARNLIVKLRQALHSIRKQQIERMDAAIRGAEGPL